MSAFISPDRYFDPETGRLSAYFSKLFILIGRESLQYCILDTDKNSFVALADVRMTVTPKTPEAYSTEISRIFSEEEELKKKYPSVIIGLDTSIHTLVPAPLYEADKNEKYLEFNFGISGNGEVRADQLEEIDAWNVYVIPQGLIDVVRDNYSEAAIFHRSSALIKMIYHHLKVNPLQAGIFLNVREQSIDLASFKGGRLIFFNSFDCNGKEDMLYYTLYTIEQLNLEPDNVQLVISGMVDIGSEPHYLLEQYINPVLFLERLNLWDYSPLLNQLPAQRYQELYALALCGS